MKDNLSVITLDFFETLLTNAFNQKFIYNEEYLKILKGYLKSKDITDQETSCIKFLIKGINNSTEKCYNEASKTIKGSAITSNLISVIYSLFYMRYLLKMFIEEKIKLKESNLKDHSFIISNLEEKVLRDSALKLKYLWLPKMAEGQLYYLFDQDFAIQKFRNAMEIAKKQKYFSFPISYVYAFLGELYYEKGYFDDAIHIYNEGFEKWSESTYLINNRAFVLSVVKDKKAFEALKNVKDNSDVDDPIPLFNLAGYKLYRAINGDETLDVSDVPKLLKNSFINFLSDFRKYKNKIGLLDIFPCSVLENIAQEKQREIAGNFSDLSLDEKETIASQDVLLELFCDLENFVTDSFKINRTLSAFLDSEKTIKSDNNIFIVLKRWSSYTPLIPSKSRNSRGGGHYFTWKGKGFIIDPGPHFIENFIEQGFRLADIDCVICSHGHIDHTQDLERIITLLYEKNDRNENKQKIRLVLSPGCASKYGSLLSASSDVIESCIVLYPNKDIKVNDLKVSFTPILANHSEIFARKDTALSFTINLLSDTKIEYKIGFTNDTGFIDNKKTVETFFCSEFDLLIANLGSDNFARLTKLAKCKFPSTWLKELRKDSELYLSFNDPDLVRTLGYKDFNEFEKIFFKGELTSEYEWYKTHLGFRGLLRLALGAKFKYLIISEFGEELKSYRHLFARSLNKKLTGNGKVITGDVGTKFKIEDGNIFSFCDFKNEYINRDIVEKIVKNEDYRVIHINSKHYNSVKGKKAIQDMFGYLI